MPQITITNKGQILEKTNGDNPRLGRHFCYINGLVNNFFRKNSIT